MTHYLKHCVMQTHLWIIHDSLHNTFCYADACVIQCRSFAGGSVMVRWGITERDRIPLVVDGNLTGIRYQDEIVQRYVIPFTQAQANNVTFQHDNARSHVARVVWDYLPQQNVHVLPWPVVSPDLSPIEHLGWNGTTVTSSTKSAIDVIGNGSGIDSYLEQNPTRTF